jgi:hypothetical protein
MPHKVGHHTHHGGLIPIKLNLSHHQAKKASHGHPIQLKHHEIGVGHLMYIHPETHKKLVHAHKHGKGARIHLSHHELHGSGFLDILKKVASPVLSGLAGVAGELFPSHKDTINKVRQGIKDVTGYGLRPRKQMHEGHAMHSNHHGFMHGDGINGGPEHFPGGYQTDQYGFGIKKHTPKHKKKHHKKYIKHDGSGIIPAGFGY